ncbi:MAG: 1-(5-phosphoribosyl)-5-[(5-phosphoribosylamino)methylideneamino] imidazole-4-carboxamide isomerase [Candidatus Altiarchaeota archaeon]
MQVIPAVDLMGGRCVQLVGGRPETRIDYGDPVEKALEWVGEGASMLHLVDLDAALGFGSNLEVMLKVKRSCAVPVELGGGIRDIDSARMLLEELGEEDRIIIGTMAVKEYPGFKTLKELEEYSDRIIVSVDSKGGRVVSGGWAAESRLTAAQVMEACGDLVWGFLYTDVDVEGRMGGVNNERVREVVRSTHNPVIVSGGVTSKVDVDACEEVGAWGVVLGKALYEGKMTLREVV